jgi:hypothetical protein
MRKNDFSMYTLLLIFGLVFGNGIITYAQAAESSATSLPKYIKAMGLSTGKMEQALKLTRDFLSQLQDANLELTKIMIPSESGSQSTPKAKEKLAWLKRSFGVQMKKYHANLEKLVGTARALRIAEKIHVIVPQVLIEELKMPGMNQNGKISKKTAPTPTALANVTPTSKILTGGAKVKTILTGLTSSAPDIPAAMNSNTATTPLVTPAPTLMNNGPQEIPLGNLPGDLTNPVGTTSSSGAAGLPGALPDLDLQIVGNSNSASGHDHGNGDGMNGMDAMMSMMSGMMGNMGNMSTTNNNQAVNGLDLINRQLVLQYLANNASIIQMLATLSYQEGKENLPLLLQPIYQLLANQATLIQILYANFG